MRRVLFIVGLMAAAAGLAAALGLFERRQVAPVEDTPAPVTSNRPQPRDTSAPQPRAEAVREPESRPTPARPTEPPPPPPEPEAPTTATLRIDSDVPGAQVFIDNKFVGNAPATATGVAPGQRKINVQAPGYDGVVEFVDVTPGSRDLTFSLKTIRLDQKVSVVHKHRLGQCTGTLIATPEGIRYETDNKDDGFTVALTGLETFEVNFLQKNLKLKVRGGRSYDFTDPSGKADALYLFHQEVDKVRKKVTAK